MTSKLLMMVMAVAGCATELEIETQGQAESAIKVDRIECYELDAGNSICRRGDIEFETRDLALTECTKTRRGLSCVALQSLSPLLPPELWGAVGSSNGGVWKTTDGGVGRMTCPDAELVNDGGDPLHVWCSSLRTDAGTGQEVETEFKVEKGE